MYLTFLVSFKNNFEHEVKFEGLKLDHTATALFLPPCKYICLLPWMKSYMEAAETEMLFNSTSPPPPPPTPGSKLNSIEVRKFVMDN